MCFSCLAVFAERAPCHQARLPDSRNPGIGRGGDVCKDALGGGYMNMNETLFFDVLWSSNH